MINGYDKALAMSSPFVLMARCAFSDISETTARQHKPKFAFVGAPQFYVSSSCKQVNEVDIDLNVRALSMGKLPDTPPILRRFSDL